MIDWTHDLINAGGSGPHEGAGCCLLARMGAEPVGSDGRFVCVDLNRGMVPVATRCVTEEGVTATRWCQGDVSMMPFSSGEVDTSANRDFNSTLTRRLH